MDKYLIIILSPLIASLLCGWGGRLLGNIIAPFITIIAVFVSFVLSTQVLLEQIIFDQPTINENLYTWLSFSSFSLHIGILIDELTAVMIFVVSFISLLVHIYTLGYFKGEKHFTRFFSYISLFTFAMLMLVMSNNFMQLFFGWEAVGLISYLLIGFYYERESSIIASFKAFLVNRVGDFGFLLGISLIAVYTQTLDYVEVFNQLSNIASTSIMGFDAISVITIFLFIGAMGKSAQIPLHVWLPGSMEGPTPISALIHAATMVTAGIFMVARLSPMFELSVTTLTFIMVVGCATALFMGLIGIVQNDIKKVIAYSTLSQLGYMTAALGLGAYHIAIFHLFTHAFFKALLFLAAGSVIVATHHEQDIRKMGGLWRKMPITFVTFVIGTLAIIGFPGFAGFYSKDMIIIAANISSTPYADVAYYILLGGVAITTVYMIRLLILVFLGNNKDSKIYREVHESPFSITIPLIILAIASAIAGFIGIEFVLSDGVLNNAINVPIIMHDLADGFNGSLNMILHAFETSALYIMLGSCLFSFIIFLVKTDVATLLSKKLTFINKILLNLYYFDKINNILFVKFSLIIAKVSNFIDKKIIDDILVDGLALSAHKLGKIIRLSQTGYIYHYGFFMIIGLLIMLVFTINYG